MLLPYSYVKVIQQINFLEYFQPQSSRNSPGQDDDEPQLPKSTSERRTLHPRVAATTPEHAHGEFVSIDINLNWFERLYFVGMLSK